MKRKIFSKLLMGALLVASVSSFTSCKDYDDDINGLRNDVEKRALQSELTALQTTVAGVQSTASDALAKATAAATATDLNSVKTDLAAVKTTADKAATDAAKGIKDAATAQEAAAAAQKAADDATDALKDYVKTADMEAALKKYVTATAFKEAVDGFKAQFDEFVNTNNGSLEEMKAEIQKFKDTYAQIWSAVTSVSIYATTDATGLLQVAENTVSDLQFSRGTVAKAAKRFTRFDHVAPKLYEDGVFGDSEKKDFFAGAAVYNAQTSATFADKEKFAFPKSIVVRVSPTNAVLTKDNIQLINGNGVALNAVDVIDVKPYSKLLTRAANNGLWEIVLQANTSISADNFNKAVRAQANANGVMENKKDGANAVLFAVAVNNTKDVEDAAARAAVSEYGLTINKALEPYVGVWDVRFQAKVNNKVLYDLATPANSVGGRTKATTTATIKGGKAEDKAWTDRNAGNNNISSAQDRTGYAAIAINNGGTVTVDLTSVKSFNTAVGDGPFTPKYYYVVRDDANAGGSEASELNAWNTYQYGENLGKLYPVSEKCEFTITIPEGSLTGDYIGFRIFAVNYDGTLCDPDGDPFEVWVGSNKNAVTAIGDFIPKDGEATDVTVMLPISGKFVNNSAAMSTTGDKALAAGGSKKFLIKNIKYYKSLNADGTGKDQVGTAVNTAADAAYVQVTVGKSDAANWADWVDGTSVEFVSTTNSATPAVPENAISITLTKVLPDATNAKAYTWKANQKSASGDFIAYMYPATAISSTAWTTPSWTSALGTTKYAFKPMSQAINDLWDETASAATDNYVFKFGTSKYNATSKTYADDFEVKKTTLTYSNPTLKYSYIVSLEEAADPNDAITELVDGTTKHASSINYNFGKVSSATVDENGTVIDYVVKLEDFNTIWACPLNEGAQTFAFEKINLEQTAGKAAILADVNYLIYNNENIADDLYKYNSGVKSATKVGLTPTAFMDYILATNVFDNVEFGGKLSATNVKGKYVRIATKALDGEAYKPTLTSDSNGKEDYFTVAADFTTGFTFTKNSAITNPTADVPSHLTFYLLDAFGHYNKVSLPFTVKRAE